MMNFQTKRNLISVHRWLIISFSLLILLTIGCDFSFSGNQSLEQTQAALNIQMTMVAQKAGQDAQAADQAVSLTQAAAAVQSTLLAYQATQLAQQPVTTQAPPVQTTEVSVPATEAPVQVNLDEQIKNAKILLFEDISGTGELEYIQEALESGGYTFKDDGSAEGWFKDDLLSTTDWDLIITANEWRRKIEGEYFTYLLDHINRGTSVIIEHYNLDSLSLGKVAAILSRCGVGLQKDWFVQTSGVPNLSIAPLVPDHPVFHEPNTGISLRGFNNFWHEYTDKGDLLKITGGDATLLTGTIATSKMDHGTLVTCLEGRLMIQTHSTHEYKYESSIALWQNMIYYTLKNHFLTQQ